MAIAFDKDHAALLLLAFQNSIVDAFADHQPGIIDRTARLAEAWRRAGRPVIHVVNGNRPGYPEVPLRRRAARIASGMTEEGRAIPPALTPVTGDVVVTKSRIGSFSGTDLGIILRAAEITTVVLTGIATSGAVLGACRQAADEDYDIIVVSDCCADDDDEVHRVLLEKVMPTRSQARVVTADEVMEGLTSS